METIKTAVVVVLLLSVLYGVYVVLNKPVEPLPESIAWHDDQVMEPLEVDLGPGLSENASSALPESASRSAMLDAATQEVPAATQAMPLSAPATPVQPPQSEDTWPEITGFPEDPPAAPHRHAPDEAHAMPQSPAAAAETTESPPASPPSYYASQQSSNSQYGAEMHSGQPASETTLEEAPAPKSNPPLASNTDFGSDSPSSRYGSEVPPPTRFDPFQNALQSATTKIEDQQWYDALWTLSLFFNSPDLTPEQQDELLNWLDPLAAKVVYSQEHLIEPAYLVQRGDTLQTIADRYSVPWQLLANINGVDTPQLLTPGTSLKVVRGPFRAEVDLTRSEMTLFAGKLYAGRFPVTIGADPQPQPGEYTVRDKQPGRTYYAGDGQTVASSDPTNPFGQVWIDLGNDVSIHGSPQSGSVGSHGCISLSPQDANDVIAILSNGSRVLIRR